MRLFIRQRFFSWTDSFDITDEEGYAVYSVLLFHPCVS